jgi:hypothetical protein
MSVFRQKEPTMNRQLRRRTTRSLAAAAALVLGLAACSDDEPSNKAEKSQVADPVTTEPTEVPEFTLLDPAADGSVELDPGTYALSANVQSAPLAALDVPAGFYGFHGWALRAVEEGPGYHYSGIGYFSVAGLYENPCTRQGQRLETGTSVDELVAALDRQQMTSTSEPAPVSIGGHDGVYVELTASPSLRLKSCKDGGFEIWQTSDGGSWWLFEPGQVDRLWIVDVDGERVVLDARAVPGVTDEETQALKSIVESVSFVS